MAHYEHANFNVASPEGSADDVVAAIVEVRRQVSQRLGMLLKAEVRLLGFLPHSVSTSGSDTPGVAPGGTQ